MKKILLFTAVFFGLRCSAQTYSPNDFEQVPVPKPGSPQWYQLDTSRDKAFSVSTIDGKLNIKEFTHTSVKKYSLPNGEFYAIDHGEFGGGLLYNPNQKNKSKFYVNGKLVYKQESSKLFWNTIDTAYFFKGKQLLVKFGNVKNIFSFKDSTFFLEGLDHMGFDEGSLYKLQLKKDSVSYIKILDFGDAPHAIAIHRDTIFMATFTSFYIIHNWNKELIFDKLFWYGLNPNSVAVLDENNIYVGMHGGYAKIDLSTKTLTFFKHKTP
jgi:hypothetical protein